MQAVNAAEQRNRLSMILNRLYNAPPNFNFPGHVTAANPNIIPQGGANHFPAGVLDMLRVGDTVEGVDIPGGTTIIKIDVSGLPDTIVMSANAAATADITVSDVAVSSGEIHLYTAVVGPGPTPVPSSFTEADFDTYIEQALANPTGPYTTADGSAQADFAASWILVTNPVVSNTILGYWVDYLVNGTRVVAFYESFPAPIQMAAAGNAVVLTIPVKIPNPGSVVIG